MTVKIIGHPLPRRVICEYCECELEYLKSDIRWNVRRGMKSGIYHYIQCPNCKRSVHVDSNQPPNVR